MEAQPENWSEADAMEVNFVIRKFRELPDVDKARLANAIRAYDEDKKGYVEAGWEIFGAIVAPEVGDELTAYATEVLRPGERVVDRYVIMPDDYSAKAARCSAYFRDHLSSEPDSFDIAEIALEESGVTAL